MDDFEKNDAKKELDAVYSKSVKAGKRTYFFDVKKTRQNEHYITITESKKVFEDNGNSHFEKHKIFLYKEDFEKFMDCFDDVLQYISENSTEPDAQIEKPSDSNADDRFTNVNFEDLDK